MTEDEGRKLDQTPTWAVAGVCAFIVLISIGLENVLHDLGMLLRRKKKGALYEALDKIKGELMVLGFISLLLTFTQRYMTRICVPSRITDTMLPCLRIKTKSSDSNGENRRRLLWSEGENLAAAGYNEHKCNDGYEPLITFEAAHQLDILIFFLAVFHVLYSAVTMMLGKLKIRGWKKWERETSTRDYELTNDPSRFRLTHETSFVKRHNSSWTRIPFFFYVGCFFRQFYKSVDKADYLTLRNGFITAHISPGRTFDFQNYVKKSLEDDFKMVVGVSPALWASFVIFLLLNVKGWHTLLWASVLPLIAILAIGTKLQAILTKMALEITERHTIVQGIPLVRGSDTYFWFSKPQLILHLLHFALFQIAFQITYFLWILYEFGLQSCFHDKILFELTKILIGIGATVLCSYSILPLYALVTQMGSHMKQTVFDEQTTTAITEWHKAVKKKHGKDNTSARTIGGTRSEKSENSLRRDSNRPVLHRFLSSGRCLSRVFACDELDLELETCHIDDQERSTAVAVVAILEDGQGESRDH
ncbi:hypothetical protein RND81_11G226300 [Saponaria officinalis]|uniref:MLO-like protein n=1 Tax=Saponaria officinalis TaxID=3572 RepID=A0AAW1HRC2_SAPOF